jgi:diaminopimelate decarboxylase
MGSSQLMNSSERNEIFSLYQRVGGSFFVLDLETCKNNFLEFFNAFNTIYPHFKIAYSFKTNYAPLICKTFLKEGAKAEVVSEMELQLAEKLGATYSDIIVNGPFHKQDFFLQLIQKNILVNIDSYYQIEYLKDFIREGLISNCEIGLRFNLSGPASRFGFDSYDESIKKLLLELDRLKVNVVSIHNHEISATRSSEDYHLSAKRMLEIYDKYFQGKVKSINLGGGFYSNMSEELKAQFSFAIPSFQEYAEAIAKPFQEYFKNKSEKPFLILEPGIALVADAMKFYSSIIDIKTIKDKSFALLDASIYDIKPTKAKRNLPCSILKANPSLPQEEKVYDLVGYTCMEDDVMYTNFKGNISKGDILVFDNVGAYTNVLKPPFINPARPIFVKDKNDWRMVRREEDFTSFFNSYSI